MLLTIAQNLLKLYFPGLCTNIITCTKFLTQQVQADQEKDQDPHAEELDDQQLLIYAPGCPATNFGVLKEICFF